MADRPVVIFDGVWKKFRRGERHDSLRDLVPDMVRRLVRRGRRSELEHEEFWALGDVSFEARRGEAIGIIGPNGAGKSTALKLLTRILRPTRGECSVKGRVGALIEVAAGFHPDLTGRENVYLQGAIMGMKRLDIQQRFDDIVDFSGIGAFIDTPVKRYSSGMQARLGFSIAAHLEPDVLFVDEVLSVGDMSFQNRCMEKMVQQLRSGVTVVFVSHNMQAVAALCSRTIVLAEGRKVFEGAPAAAIDTYLKAASAGTSRRPAEAFRVRSAELEVIGNADTAGGMIRPHTKCRLTLSIECLEDSPPWCLGFIIERTSDLLYCYGASSEELGQPLFRARAGEVTVAVIDFVAHFSRGHYRINVNVRDPRQAMHRMIADSVATFAIDDQQTYKGVVDVETSIRVHQSTTEYAVAN